MTMTSTPTGAALSPNAETFRDPVRASQYIFRVTLDALANPGTMHSLIMHPQVTTEDLVIRPYVASVLVTMLDHEVSLHLAPAIDADDLHHLLVRHTRVAITSLENADFVAADTTMEATLPGQMKRGSLEYPDDGATLVVSGISFDPATPGAIDLTLRGPGIPVSRSLSLAGMPAQAIASRNQAVENYPTGIDLLLIDDNGQVVGLPRTTSITINQDGGH